MATVTTKTYPTIDMSEIIADITSAYDWEKVDSTQDNITNFYVDADKYIQINDSSDGIRVYNGTVSHLIVSLSFGAGYKINTRFAKCRTGVILQFSLNNFYEYSPLIIIGTATNPITNANEKVIFFETSTSASSFACGIFSSDNKTNTVKIQSFPGTKFASKLTTAIKLSTDNSEFVMDNALFIFNSELSSLSHGSVTFGGKNYYMMSAFMLED